MIAFGSTSKQQRPFTLLSLVDSAENELRITLADSYLGNPGEDFTPTGNAVFDTAMCFSRPVRTDVSNAYEIIFPSYIIHQVRNESFTGNDPYEIFAGQYFRIYTRSHLLDSLSTFTSAQRYDDGSYYPGRWTHYEIITYSHIIDVVSTDEPIIVQHSQDKC